MIPLEFHSRSPCISSHVTYLLGSQSDEGLKLIRIRLRLESVQLSVLLPQLLVFGRRANHCEQRRTTAPKAKGETAGRFSLGKIGEAMPCEI